MYGGKEMKTIYEGKTKNVLQHEDGSIWLFFKDDMTGKDGVFDPGENQVGLTVEGSGRSGLAVSQYFFEKLNAQNVPTHYISADLDKRMMKVHPVSAFGQGIEVICRFRAAGSFLKRYGAYVQEGQDLDAYVEFSLKDDERQDPFINKRALEILGIVSKGDYKIIVKHTREISEIIRAELAKKGLELYDIKLEFGKDQETGEILLIDELSAGNMRVYKDGKLVSPLQLEAYLLD